MVRLVAARRVLRSCRVKAGMMDLLFAFWKILMCGGWDRIDSTASRLALDVLEIQFNDGGAV